MKGLGIVLLCILAAVGYGIVHDQVTARICVEYFTIGHPPVFGTDSPTLLGIAWGILATWWVGLFLGIGLAAAARLGAHPKRSAAELARPIGKLLLAMAVCAAAAGLIGYAFAVRGLVVLTPDLASEIPPGRRVPFLTDLWIHNASYAAGFVGGLVVIVGTWIDRRRDGRPSRSSEGVDERVADLYG